MYGILACYAVNHHEHSFDRGDQDVLSFEAGLREAHAQWGPDPAPRLTGYPLLKSLPILNARSLESRPLD